MENDSALRKLEKAYFEMLEKENYAKLSVSDIVSKAGVSRTTFYRHYVDIFDMHKKIAEKFASTIIDECVKLILSSNGETDCLQQIVGYFYSQEKYVKLISGENGSRYFFEAIYCKAVTSISSNFPNLSEDELFRLRFLTVSTMGSYIKDILEGREHNADFIPICKKVLSFEETFGGHYAK